MNYFNDDIHNEDEINFKPNPVFGLVKTQVWGIKNLECLGLFVFFMACKDDGLSLEHVIHLAKTRFNVTVQKINELIKLANDSF